jgi:uncharacterized C2H2 Zn-finger protein
MAKVRKFKCPKCGRRFSMAAHLGRHMNTMHASRRGKKLVSKKATRRARKRVARPAVRAGAARRPAARATGALRAIRAYRQTLVARRAELDSRVNAIDRALAALGAVSRPVAARAARAPRSAGSRTGSLKYFIERVLSAGKGPMAVKDTTAAVLKAGFKTRNKTLAKSVGVALSQMANVVKVSRGRFRLRR